MPRGRSARGDGERLGERRTALVGDRADAIRAQNIRLEAPRMKWTGEVALPTPSATCDNASLVDEVRSSLKLLKSKTVLVRSTMTSADSCGSHRFSWAARSVPSQSISSVQPREAERSKNSLPVERTVKQSKKKMTSGNTQRPGEDVAGSQCTRVSGCMCPACCIPIESLPVVMTTESSCVANVSRVGMGTKLLLDRASHSKSLLGGTGKGSNARTSRYQIHSFSSFHCLTSLYLS